MFAVDEVDDTLERLHKHGAQLRRPAATAADNVGCELPCANATDERTRTWEHLGNNFARMQAKDDGSGRTSNQDE